MGERQARIPRGDPEGIRGHAGSDPGFLAEPASIGRREAQPFPAEDIDHPGPAVAVEVCREGAGDSIADAAAGDVMEVGIAAGSEDFLLVIRLEDVVIFEIKSRPESLIVILGLVRAGPEFLQDLLKIDARTHEGSGIQGSIGGGGWGVECQDIGIWPDAELGGTDERVLECFESVDDDSGIPDEDGVEAIDDGDEIGIQARQNFGDEIELPGPIESPLLPVSEQDGIDALSTATLQEFREPRPDGRGDRQDGEGFRTFNLV